MFYWVTGFEVQVAFTKLKIMRQRENKVTIRAALRDSDNCPRGVKMVKVTQIKQHLIEPSILNITSIYKKGLIHLCLMWLLDIQISNATKIISEEQL